jgi:hypothetical protein
MDKTKQTALTVRRRARRHTQVEIAARLAEYRASGLTAAEFAARSGMRPATLLNWHYGQRRKSEPRPGSGFARVQVQSARAGTLTVRWPQGVEAAVAVDLDAAGVVRIVRDLLAPCWR